MFPDCLVPHTKRFLMSSLCVYIKFTCIHKHTRASQVAVTGKEPTSQGRRYERLGFDPWIRNISWKRKWHPTRRIQWWVIVWSTEEPGGLQSMGSQSRAQLSIWAKQNIYTNTYICKKYRFSSFHQTSSILYMLFSNLLCSLKILFEIFL